MENTHLAISWNRYLVDMHKVDTYSQNCNRWWAKWGAVHSMMRPPWRILKSWLKDNRRSNFDFFPNLLGFNNYVTWKSVWKESESVDLIVQLLNAKFGKIVHLAIKAWKSAYRHSLTSRSFWDVGPRWILPWLPWQPILNYFITGSVLFLSAR